MEQTFEKYEFGLKDVSIKIQRKVTDSGIKQNKCNQCDFASSHTTDMRRHLRTHSGEKPNICNLCGFASVQAGSLKTHLKTHSGERLNKYNQCDFAFCANCARYLQFGGDQKWHFRSPKRKSETTFINQIPPLNLGKITSGTHFRHSKVFFASGFLLHQNVLNRYNGQKKHFRVAKMRSQSDFS